MAGIDYKAVRREVPIELVLDLLEWEPKYTRGNQLRGWCPLHSSPDSPSDSFSVNVERDCFQCFKCHAQGNQLDLWAKFRNLSLYKATKSLLTELGQDPPWIERW